MNIQEYEQIVPHIAVDGIDFLTPNSQCAWRVETLYTKEPDTIEWIKNMLPGETLYDVGANMGQYTMFAAKRGIKVHAFEPEAQNFALLVRNLVINKMTDMATAWPLALSDHPSIDKLHLSTCTPGGSCHSFGAEIDFHGTPKQFPHVQGSVSTTLDIFAAKYGAPDYIKLDVDGFEHLVMEGAVCTLSKVKSCLIEINTAYPQHMVLVEKMQLAGFTHDSHQVQESQRKEGPFKGVGNWIFYKV